MRPARLSETAVAHVHSDCVTITQVSADGETRSVTLMVESIEALLPVLERFVSRKTKGPRSQGGPGPVKGGNARQVRD